MSTVNYIKMNELEVFARAQQPFVSTSGQCLQIYRMRMSGISNSLWALRVPSSAISGIGNAAALFQACINKALVEPLDINVIVNVDDFHRLKRHREESSFKRKMEAGKREVAK